MHSKIDSSAIPPGKHDYQHQGVQEMQKLWCFGTLPTRVQKCNTL